MGYASFNVQTLINRNQSHIAPALAGVGAALGTVLGASAARFAITNPNEGPYYFNDVMGRDNVFVEDVLDQKGAVVGVRIEAENLTANQITNAILI